MTRIENIGSGDIKHNYTRNGVRVGADKYWFAEAQIGTNGLRGSKHARHKSEWSDPPRYADDPSWVESERMSPVFIRDRRKNGKPRGMRANERLSLLMRRGVGESCNEVVRLTGLDPDLVVHATKEERRALLMAQLAA